MKRLNLILRATALAAVVMTAIPVNAQENGNRDENGRVVRGPYETNRFADNWFIGSGSGVNFLFDKGYEAAPAFSMDAYIGKWFTPSVGMRIGYQGLQSRVWADSPSVLGNSLDAGKDKYLQKFGYMYIHGDFLWNASNALGGYKETRFWNFVPYVHTGFYRSYGLGDNDYADNELALGVGLMHSLRLTERLDLNIDMRGTVVNGRIHQSDGVAVLTSATVGMGIDLGYPAFVRTSTMVAALEAENIDEVAAMAAAAAAIEVANESLAMQNKTLKHENRRLVNELTEAYNRPQFDVEAFFEGMSPATIYFDIGKSVLNEKELNYLDFVTRNIISKVDDQTEIMITVMGSADANTGSEQRNRQLSEARGKYVTELMTKKYGISPERLSVRSEIVKAESKPELQRAVIISF